MSVKPNHGGDILYSDINENEIMCGRGTKYCKHPGNKNYYVIVEKNCPAFRQAGRGSSKQQCLQVKTEICRNIISSLRDLGARFLSKKSNNLEDNNCGDDNQAVFHEIGDKKALEKTAQLLREMTNKGNHRTIYQKRLWDKKRRLEDTRRGDDEFFVVAERRRRAERMRNMMLTVNEESARSPHHAQALLRQPLLAGGALEQVVSTRPRTTTSSYIMISDDYYPSSTQHPQQGNDAWYHNNKKHRMNGLLHEVERTRAVEERIMTNLQQSIESSNTYHHRGLSQHPQEQYDNGSVYYNNNTMMNRSSIDPSFYQPTTRASLLMNHLDDAWNTALPFLVTPNNPLSGALSLDRSRLMSASLSPRSNNDHACSNFLFSSSSAAADHRTPATSTVTTSNLYPPHSALTNHRDRIFTYDGGGRRHDDSAEYGRGRMY
mmetsp:Transcript_29546/g.33972  ORF Transcript_29546/g.33972 Transcript_29546/m.33972 type:complete len:433 (+) Transcript_29546:232-1530(+)